jgi:hypothetical protein
MIETAQKKPPTQLDLLVLHDYLTPSAPSRSGVSFAEWLQTRERLRSADFIRPLGLSCYDEITDRGRLALAARS